MILFEPRWPEDPPWREFERRRDGMLHAMAGGLWLHRHVWFGRAMAHLVSVDRAWLIAVAIEIQFPHERLQYKPLKDPRTDLRVDTWHFDLGGPFLPPRRARQVSQSL